MVLNYHLWKGKGTGKRAGELVGDQGRKAAKRGRGGGKKEKGGKAEENGVGEHSGKEKEERKGENHKGPVESEVRKMKEKDG